MTHKTEGRYKVEVTDDRGDSWASNALRFDTVEEAADYGRDLFSRWMAIQAWRVADTESDGAVVAGVGQPVVKA